MASLAEDEWREGLISSRGDFLSEDLDLSLTPEAMTAYLAQKQDDGYERITGLVSWIVEAVFRNLTDVNAEGSAIRRPLAFQKLCAVTGAKPEKLRTILHAFRAPGVSFLTPYDPKPIDDRTPIDISHEALIRCWRKIGDKSNGWLQKEARDGLAWRALLYQAETFSNDGQSFLSQPETELRAKWLRWRNAAWAERYGGGWPKVEALSSASREYWKQEAEKKEADRQKAVDKERLRREAAERSASAAKETALREKERARRSRLVAITASIVAAMALALAAYAAYLSQDRLREEIYLPANVSALTAAEESALKAGDSFKECRDCPEMIVAPAGRFRMGSPADQGYPWERPQHEVTMAKPFAVAKFQLTFDEWDACVSLGDCERRVGDSSWGRGRRPVINVSWDDAQSYIRWLSRITGKKYRLLSDAEYEYAARAGNETKYPWGDGIKLDGRAMANCDGCGSQRGGERTAPVCGSEEGNQPTPPVCSFAPNAFGLYDMVGNVWEWTEDCWHDNYEGAPADSFPWTSGDCSRRVVRGGSWRSGPDFLRSAARGAAYAVGRDFDLGFRVARTLSP